MLNMLKGMAYHFNAGRQQRDDGAQRAGFLTFQAYPANEVQGRATLVGNPMGIPGKYWTITQPPQIGAVRQSVMSDIYGGGDQAGFIMMQPLSDTSKSMG